ncbi:MAG: hypothetical protein HC799_13665 [Limnothrix sp. RL_2_0]|nr:hypothetical protein [Limnothrix sp. RL_2_0]
MPEMMSENHPAKLDLTLKLGHKTKTAIISKTIVLAALSIVCGIFFSKEAETNVQKVAAISLEQCAQEACIEEVSAYKSLLSAEQGSTNIAVNIPVMFLAVSILFGFYELLAMLMGLVVRKIVD